jgi:NADP-dependent 3-hydroxy acid dehydrogenase YdfG
MGDYSGKVVVITGASSGIGAALARELDARGARLVLAARSAEPLQAVADSCRDAVAVVTDVTVRADVEHLLRTAVGHFGQVDVWVNNAGRGIGRPVLELTDDDVEDMVRTNVLSALYGMQTVLPAFTAQGYGVLANVSSMLGRVPFATFRSAYSASKAALNSLTESLRLDLAREHPGIRVVLVLPGVVATDFGVNALGGGVDSRSMPGAQDVDDAARAIADGLLDGPEDIYTRGDGLEPTIAHLRALAGDPTRTD